jgi:hypothetical protein
MQDLHKRLSVWLILAGFLPKCHGFVAESAFFQA